MAPTTSKRHSTAEELAELRSAIDRLTQHVHCLTQAVDGLTEEVQWQNNQARDGHLPSPPFVLHSMPKDPTDKDWRINQVMPHEAADDPAPRSARETLFD